MGQAQEERIRELEKALADAKAKSQQHLVAKTPKWAIELADQYRGGSICEFLVTGNISDLVPLVDQSGMLSFVSIRKFLAEMLFARRDAVIFFDPAGGITFEKAETYGDFHNVMAAVDIASGTQFANRGLPRDPRRALFLIGRYLQARLVGSANRAPKSIAVVIDFTQLICPEGRTHQLSFDEQATLVTLIRWASDPLFLKSDVTIILIAENLSQVNSMLVKNPYIGKINVDLPDREERMVFLKERFKTMQSLAGLCESPIDMEGTNEAQAGEFHSTWISGLTAGLSRINLEHILKHAEGNNQRIDVDFINNSKKDLIEKECYGLLEFLNPKWKLNMVSGHNAAKSWLLDDAELIKKGRLDCLPMGYLICGPVGTGKSFLVECFTGEIGIPCVKLKNMRSQWQGVTEGNWEKILSVLKATGPVGVIIDEADAALGNRNASGDSGTSTRIFSMLAAQMGDTRYRGKILWFLITCRPDLLPVDLKRQGRAEVHIPLFYPETEEEKVEIIDTMSKKVGAQLGSFSEGSEEDRAFVLEKLDGGKDDECDDHDCDDHDHDHSHGYGRLRDGQIEAASYSGADIEGIVIRAKRRAALNDREAVTFEDLKLELANFIRPEYPAKIYLQELAAVVECSDERFLPKHFREMPNQQRMEQFLQVKMMVDRRSQG